MLASSWDDPGEGRETGMRTMRHRCCCGWELVWQESEHISYTAMRCRWCNRYFVELPEEVKVPEGVILVWDEQDEEPGKEMCNVCDEFEIGGRLPAGSEDMGDEAVGGAGGIHGGVLASSGNDSGN